MYAENRRLERRQECWNLVRENFNIKQPSISAHYETEDLFLEGTGSMVLDREKQLPMPVCPREPI